MVSTFRQFKEESPYKPDQISCSRQAITIDGIEA
jgi:hypothetical protein